ncbi:type II secretion system protein GspG [Alcaligenaceae bacterium 429]|nr:type II secretion system protein GspG [Alcaligenaceae bacterium 429]
MTPQHSLPRSTAAQASQRGFSLIEIMVVIVIMGIMAALVVPNLLSRPDQARVVAAKQDIAGIMQALKLYRLDNGFYPNSQQGLQALQQKPSAPPVPQNWQRYLDKVPTDPWGNAYQYLNPGVSNDVDVFSFGADGQRGGEEMNADIGSWQ